MSERACTAPASAPTRGSFVHDVGLREAACDAPEFACTGASMHRRAAARGAPQVTPTRSHERPLRGSQIRQLDGCSRSNAPIRRAEKRTLADVTRRWPGAGEGNRAIDSDSAAARDLSSANGKVPPNTPPARSLCEEPTRRRTAVSTRQASCPRRAPPHWRRWRLGQRQSAHHLLSIERRRTREAHRHRCLRQG